MPPGRCRGAGRTEVAAVLGEAAPLPPADGETGKLFRRRLTPEFRDILAWILALPGPVKCVY